jgi:hypothetical protein
MFRLLRKTKRTIKAALNADSADIKCVCWRISLSTRPNPYGSTAVGRAEPNAEGDPQIEDKKSGS